MPGIVAAGHPVTAGAGADVLRAGGNAVDAALAAMLTSFVTEPLLTGLGAGGYMLVATPGREPVLLDFFVSAPSAGDRAPLVPVDVSFGDVVQVFNIGAASCGAYGTPAGIWAAADRFGSMPLPELAAGAIALARCGVEVNEADKAVSEAAHPDANIIIGAMVDEKLDDQVWVTVVATRYGDQSGRSSLLDSDRTSLISREPRGEPRVRRTSEPPPRRRETRISDELEVPEFVPRG